MKVKELRPRLLNVNANKVMEKTTLCVVEVGSNGFIKCWNFHLLQFFIPLIESREKEQKK